MITAPAKAGDRLADQAVTTIYGTSPRTRFPDAITSCIIGVSIAGDDGSVAVTDACQGVVVRLTRTACPAGGCPTL